MATLSLFSLFAAEEGDETASLIFKKAIELQARRDFKAELDIQQKSNKPPLKGVFMQKVNPDGSVYSRTEITGGYNNTVNLVKLNNAEGSFTIMADQVIKDAAPPTSKVSLPKSKESPNLAQKPEPFTYTLSHVKYQGRECYLVALKRAPETITTPYIPALSHYYIDKQTDFIYATENYNVNGQKISSISYRTVDLDPKFDDDLFKTPQHAQVRVTSSKDEFVKASLDAIKKTDPLSKKKAPESTQTGWGWSFDDLLRLSGKIFLWLGLLFIIAIIGFKLKGR